MRNIQNGNFEQEATRRLQRVRQGLRLVEEWPEVELDAAILLHEVCQGLGLSAGQIRQVLGQKGVAYLLGRGVIPQDDLVGRTPTPAQIGQTG